MKFELTFLRSKVAQRIFFLFVSCALLPITILTVISLVSVTGELQDQSLTRINRTSHSMAQEIIQRFGLLNDDLRVMASNLRINPNQDYYYIPEESTSDSQPRFKGLLLITENGTSRTLFGHIPNPPELSPVIRDKIQDNMTAVLSKYQENDPAQIFMALSLDPKHRSRDVLLAEVSYNFILSALDDELLPVNSHVCVLDQSNNILRSTLLPPLEFSEDAQLQMEQRHFSVIEWSHRGRDYLAGFRPIILPGLTFFAEDWKLVLSEQKAVVLGPVIEFRKTFPLGVLAALWFVLFLSVIQIRRSMVPLERLKEGTKRIAKREFESRVIVTSNDEFEEVAESFNSMAGQLGKQFKALATMGDIDRAILSVLDTKKIVNTLVSRVREVFPCKSTSITVIDPASPESAQTYIGDDQSKQEKLVEKVKITSEEMQMLRENPETQWITLDENLPHYLEPLAKRGIKSFLVLPLFLKEGLAGIISLGYIKQPKFSQEDLDNARRLANQVAVAFSNARLIEELNELNWGTLKALARTIDAKSPWTAGHSERSAKLALKIGKVMRLSQRELDDIQRAGLLHDIGKLGIPPEILDKTENLTPKEEDLMRKHASLGARILEPIAAYSEVIPIVLQHHELLDGTGYPNGLTGEAISLGARIFVIADHYDALISDRPYRKALDRKSAIKYIKERAGIKFDSKVVDAFLEVMTKEKKK